MECKHCEKKNAPLKKVCVSCYKILEGYCVNNVTGKSGYRNADGTFSVTKDDLVIQTFRAGGKGGQNQNKIESVGLEYHIRPLVL